MINTDDHSAAYQRGMDELRKHLGPMAEAYVQKIKALAPEFASVNVTNGTSRGPAINPGHCRHRASRARRTIRAGSWRS